MEVGGKVLQCDKRWTDLKKTQQEWIAHLLRERYLKGSVSGNEAIVSDVMRLIQERGIWIAAAEVERYFNSRKAKWTKKGSKNNGAK